MSRVFKTISGKIRAPGRIAAVLASLPLIVGLALTGSGAGAVDDAYRPPSDSYSGQGGFDSYRQSPPPAGDAYQPPAGAPSDGYQQPPASRGYGDSYQQPPQPPSGGGYGAYNGERNYGGDSTGYGEPYRPPQSSASREEHYDAGPPAGEPGPAHGTYTEDEIIRAGNNFFGKVSGGLASAIEWTFQKAGRPNGYILGQDAGGAFVAGLAYGEGTLYTKDAGSFKVYWQGPSVGYDFGADGSKVMTLVYNLRDPSDIFDRFGGVEGAAYLVGGVSVQLQKSGHVTLAPIRAGVGLRLGANVGYLKYTRNPTWNPF
jgi:hypothetical protein